jgi:hypothetical protein
VSDYVSATRNRALRLSCRTPERLHRSCLLAHGFSLELLNELIGAGLATPTLDETLGAGHSKGLS